MTYEYDYPRPALTVDCALFAPDDSSPSASESLEILLIRRDAPPFEGAWATPGGFVEIEEPVEEAARRELAEETGVTSVELESFGVFDAPDRDPRGRIVAVAHWALVDRGELAVEAATDAREARWFDVDNLPELAFDHDHLVADARRALVRRARSGSIGLGVLDEPFVSDELGALYALVVDRSLDGEHVAERLESLGVIEPSEGARQRYRFDRGRYRELVDEPVGLFDDRLERS